MTPKLKDFVINGLRKLHSRWLPKNIALKLAKTDEPYTIHKDKDRSRNAYKCAKCLGSFRTNEINVDHIIPVVSKSGFTTFDDYIHRLFSPVENYQILCIDCHRIKSNSETTERAEERKK